MKHYVSRLSNGLTILEVPSSDAASVVVDIFVKTGSRSETAKESGISHFLEHFLFKGTKKYPSAAAISQLVDGIGGEMNANTGKEHTQYFIKASSKNMKMIFEILTDMLQNPLLDKEELEREKGVIVEELNMYEDMPMVQIENVLEGAMWPGQPMGRDIGGHKDTVTKFTRKMFTDYLDKFYQTSNMIIAISGKYDRKLFKDLVKKHWATLPKKRHQGWVKSKNKQTKPVLAVSFKKTEQAHLTFGFRAFDFNDKRNSIASVLAAILGGGMSSRMFTEVRERRGLAYYVRSSFGSYQDTGIFGVSAGVQVNKIEEALKVISAELEKISKIEPSEKELKKAKEYIKGKSTLALEDNQTRLGWFLEEVAFKRKVEDPKNAFAKIDKVTAKQVRELAEFLFKKNNMTVGIIGPYKKTASLKKALKI